MGKVDIMFGNRYPEVKVEWGCSSVGERLPRMQEVVGSNPIISTNFALMTPLSVNTSYPWPPHCAEAGYELQPVDP